MNRLFLLWLSLLQPFALCAAGPPSKDFAVSLPVGARAVWDLSKAEHETTPTREKICVNGLWRWQPGAAVDDAPPTAHWGYFKVPGPWPGITDYMQKDCQTVWTHPNWAKLDLKTVQAAWYQREIVIPPGWSGRGIALRLECLNSLATVYLDREKAGEIRFPGGELEIGSLCHPGQTQVLSVLVVALPLRGVMMSYSDTASAKLVKGAVQRRGLCGDAYLASRPAGPRLGGARVETSVREWRVDFDSRLERLRAGERYVLRATGWRAGDRQFDFRSPGFGAEDIAEGRIRFGASWKPELLWDLDAPGNLYELELSLLDGSGNVLDTLERQAFGFREFWVEGRDFYLNGTRIFLSAVPLDNAQVSAAAASFESARESFKRLRALGINFVYTHNYGCEPGAHLDFQEILNAADRSGMLVSFSQPHFGQYDWKTADSDRANGYARHAEAYTRMAGNHPSVVCYSMSHNATGYSDDMNPDMIDGVREGRDTWARNNAKLALRAEAIVRRLDPTRLVYHHASGNLGSLHAINFYPNFAPIQELSDWFEHWATEGVKPVFTCEYGAPFTWDWTMYRGWYGGQREFGSAKVPWEFCLAEWNAQFLGDRAFRLGEPEKANLRWEARQYRAGNTWHRWDYPSAVGSARFTERYEVFSEYLRDNFRAFRAWGVSAVSPWEFGHFWTLRPDVDRGRVAYAGDWERLQRPGFSPDYVEGRYERPDLAHGFSDWQPTAAAEALLRNNGPVLGCLAGKPAAFTSKDHTFLPGETLEKQIVAINNSRRTVACRAEWTLLTPQPVTGLREFELPTGEQFRIPLRFHLPAGLAPGEYRLVASISFSGAEAQKDDFQFQVLAPPSSVPAGPRLAVFDPAGETAALLRRCGVPFDSVDAAADLAGYAALVVGKAALNVDGPAPDIARVREGLKVLMFEQSSAVLEKRFGFRVVEYGLRQVFARVPDHPLLEGIAPENLRDWRGAATLLPARLAYEMRPRHGPTVQWCGLPVTRVWRCGNRGNVASVLIEKPVRGDFLPVIDGGFSLQYSPLMVYREGGGFVVFCQLDVTGRTEIDPAAERLARNLLRFLASESTPRKRSVLYAGATEGRRHLESMGARVADYQGGKPSADQVLVAASGAPLAAHAAELAGWLKQGGRLLALGLAAPGVNAILPSEISTTNAEHISTCFEAASSTSPFAGVGPADLHNRDPRSAPLVVAGARIVGDGVLAAQGSGVVFDQLPPWEFVSPKNTSFKRTFRRASFTLTRLLANQGVEFGTPLLRRFHAPVADARKEQRWLEGFYLDRPEEWDDPYRFFRW